jgi:tetratricopeptide (TPR) repeat protein
MTKLKLLSLLAAVAAAFTGIAYGAAYLLASTLAEKRFEPRPLAIGDHLSAAARTDLPDADAQIAYWSKRIASQPRAYLDLTYLGHAYARKARETSDVGYYVRAEEALRRALRVNPGYVQAAAALASVLFSLHAFEESLAVARPIADDPRGAQALATLGDAHVALGDYGKAQAAYSKLLAWAPTPAAYSRLALLADVRGDMDEALALMDRAAELAEESGDYGESLAWYAYQIGELAFRGGRIHLAESHYRAALRLFDDYPLALAGLARAKAAQGDNSAAIDLYRRVTQIVPQPDQLAALGDLYAASGQERRAREQYETVELIGKLARINRQVYNRQLANFYSDHNERLAAALRLAVAELRVRKDVYGYDAAAWAAYKNGRHGQAQRWIAQALRVGTRDPELYYHAGMIARAQGRVAEARRLLSDALRLNPRFDPLQAPIARAALEGA